MPVNPVDHAARDRRPDTVLAECAALLHDDFASFAAYGFRELNPRTRFAMNWHFEVMATIPGTARKGRPSGMAPCARAGSVG